MNLSRVHGMLAMLAFVSIACSERTAQAPSGAPSTVDVGGAGGSVPSPTSVRLEIRPGVAFKQTLTSATGATATKTATINGLPFEIRKDEIQIGPKTYGPLKVGDHVVIDADGVRINDVSKGPLP